ncbi:MAG: fibronectin type III domain-containing protein [Brevefilum sp.]|nr:fibronectin type III domain-containing protein [Brevefilum sp.]
MRTKNHSSFLFSLFLVLIIAITPLFIGLSSVFAKGEPDKDSPPPEVEVVNPYYTLEIINLEDGTAIEKATINGPPRPLPEYEASRQASIQPLPSDGIIASFPSYSWVFGCSAVSGAMIAGYYDRNGYPNMYAGPTNGGVMPLTDTSWPTWSDGYDSYPNNPLIASHLGVDGRAIKGSIDDYWVIYGSTASDPYIGNWAQHTWSDAIGDFMKTSQSSYSNTDGSTWFYNNSYSPLTCDSMEVSYDPYHNVWVNDVDGTYGRKLFYEARGYTVDECYNQKTDNVGGGFTLADFQAEIDAGHPVLLNLAGHSIVGYGYSGSTIYIRDTWSSNTSFTPTMTWGGSYDGMVLQSVSFVRLRPLSLPPTEPTDVSASDGVFSDKVLLTWEAPLSGVSHYEVYRNTADSNSGEKLLLDTVTSNFYYDISVTQNTIYNYWVKACNSFGCSDYSSSDSGFADSEAILNSVFLPLINK